MAPGKAIQMGFDWLRLAEHLRKRLIESFSTKRPQRLIFQGYDYYPLCSSHHFVPFIATLINPMLCLQKMLILGIPAGRLLLLERCSMCCLGSSHNALTFRRSRWHYISNSYQSLSHGGTKAFSLQDYCLIECLQFINHSTHVLRSVYPKGAVQVREITDPDSGSRPNWISKV